MSQSISAMPYMLAYTAPSTMTTTFAVNLSPQKEPDFHAKTSMDVSATIAAVGSLPVALLVVAMAVYFLLPRERVIRKLQATRTRLKTYRLKL